MIFFLTFIFEIGIQKIEKKFLDLVFEQNLGNEKLFTTKML